VILPLPSIWLFWACCLTALASHPILDVFTSYGTQLLAPLTDHRFAIDALPIVDIIFTPILILTLIGCWIARRRAPARPWAPVIVAWIGFALACAYALTGLTLGYLAKEEPPKCYNHCARHAYPMVPTIFVWRVTIEEEDAWDVARRNFLFGQHLQAADFHRLAQANNECVTKARELPEVKTFTWFAGGQVCATYRQEDGRHVVEFQDMRYSLRPEDTTGMWSVQVVFPADPAKPPTVSMDHFARGIQNPWEFAKQMWNDLWRP
jgi:inner membrane protein